MPQTPEIRTATEADIGELLALWARAAAPHTHPDSAEAITRRLQRDAQLFVVAVTDGKIVGSLMGGWDGWRGYMYRLAVAPELRRNGLATRLVVEVEARLAAVGCERIHAAVVVESAGAAPFWTAMGYAPQRTIADYAKTLVG